MPPRLLTAADTSPYRALMLHAYEHAADAFTSTPEEREREPAEWWLKRVADPAGLTVAFGAFAGPEMVGTVALEFSAKPKTRHKALLIGMYVLEPFRGKGLGGTLLRAAIEHCHARGGVQVLQLEVTLGNERAEALYQSLGFQRFGIEPMAILTPGGFRSKVHMWLPLDTANERGPHGDQR